MRLISYFTSFLRNTVNIDKTRLEDMADAVAGIYRALCNDEVVGPLILGMDPQGSWAHRTIIKPVDGNEFDADFMLIMVENPGWTPARYIDEVHAALARHGVYKSMVLPAKCRCIRVVYAGDFHVDVVPFLDLAGRQVIINHDDDEWEDTNPAGFTTWLQEKDTITNDHLREVIRLVKYLRDHGGNFMRTRSVLLTAMLGERVEETRVLSNPSCYGDLPTSLLHIVNDLEAWLDLNRTKPSIADPSGATDPQGNPVTFDHRWNEADYQNFKSKITTLAADIRAAYESTDEATSLELWQKVFGSDFKKPPSSGGRLGAPAAGAAAGAGRVLQSGRSG
jgi:hypothetical protein